jgi:hypothetical protein
MVFAFISTFANKFLKNLTKENIYCLILYMKKTILFFTGFLLVLLSACNNEKKQITSSAVVKDNIVTENNMDNELQENQEVKYEISDLYSFVTSFHFHSLSMYDEKQYGFFFNISLSFNPKNGKYSFTPDGPPYQPWATGAFSVKNNSILLVPEKLYMSESFLDDSRWAQTIDALNNPWELEYYEIDDSKFFTKGLRGKNIIFGAFDAEIYDDYATNKMKPKKGEHRKVNDIEIILNGEIPGNLMENARLRSGPGINYALYKIEEPGGIAIDYLEKGKKVVIIGQTIFEDVINKQTGPWYYCRVLIYDEYTNIFTDENDEDTYNKTRCVWIFAPLVGHQ